MPPWGNIHGGRPTRMWGLPGCSPYAVVLSVLCVALFIAGIVRGDPAAIIIGVALAFVFAPFAVMAFLARRPDAWTDQIPIWDDEPSDASATGDATESATESATDAAPDASGAPTASDANDAPTRGEAPRREVP